MRGEVTWITRSVTAAVLRYAACGLRSLRASTSLLRQSDYAVLCGGGIKGLVKGIGLGGVVCVAEISGGHFFVGAGGSVDKGGSAYSLVGGHIFTLDGIFTPGGFFSKVPESETDQFVSGLGGSVSVNLDGEATAVAWGNIPDLPPVLAEEVGIGTPGFAVTLGGFRAVSDAVADQTLGTLAGGDPSVGLALLKTALLTAMIECEKRHEAGGGVVATVVVPAGVDQGAQCPPPAGGLRHGLAMA